MKTRLTLIALALGLVTQINCGSSTTNSNTSNSAPSVATTSPSPSPADETARLLADSATSIPCDDSLLQHVYHPQRLIVKNKCIAVTGTIVDATAPQKKRQPDGVRHEGDGDSHGWLKVDPQFSNLLSAGNMSDEGGNLVFEIVCEFPVTQADAQAACAGYTNSITVPPIGSHVRIVGQYVQDTNHAKWMEIHPVTSITVLP